MDVMVDAYPNSPSKPRGEGSMRVISVLMSEIPWQELAADLERQKRVQLRAAMIEARDQEQMAQITSSTSTAPVHVEAPAYDARDHSSPPPLRDGQTAEEAVQSTRESSLSIGGSPVVSAAAARLPERPPANDEPQAWTPRAVQRGG